MQTGIQLGLSRASTRRRGIAMLMLLIALIIGMILAVSFLASGSTSTGIATNLSSVARARQIAESAIAMGIQKIKSDTNWRTDFTDGTLVNGASLGGGTYVLKLNDGSYSTATGTITGDGSLSDDTTDTAVLTATATYGGVTYTAHALVGPIVTLTLDRIACSSSIETKSTSVIDSWDSSIGAYGGGNVGTAAMVSTNMTAAGKFKISDTSQLKGDAYCGRNGVPTAVITKASGATLTGSKKALDANIIIPAITAPSLGASTGDYTLSGGTTTLSSDLHCGKFTMKNAAVLQISGTVKIYAETSFLMQNSASIQLLSGAKLYIYIGTTGGKQTVTVQDTATINMNTNNPRSVLFYYLGKAHVHFIKTSQVCATVIAPGGLLHMKDSGQLYGSYVGYQLKLENASKIHHDIKPVTVPISGVYVDDGGGNWGLAADNALVVDNNAVITSWNSATVQLSTNLSTSGQLHLKGSSSVTGNALSGPGSVASTVITVDSGATLTGTKTAATNSVDIVEADEPDLGANVGNVTYSAGTTVLSTSQCITKLTLKNAAILQISGDVVLICTDDIVIDNTSQIQILANSSLTIYAEKLFNVKSSGQVNVGGNYTKCVINSSGLGGDNMLIQNSGKLCATVLVANTSCTIQDTTAFWGTIRADSVNIKGSAAVKIAYDQGDGPADNGSGYTFTYVDQP